ncbi:prolyl oligopeptidase family protein [Halanaerobium saccharolyticum]|uniref:Prolyl oligopeptidase family protein n=1 Tax=Halanaerobium saccharolyticum TaxID=43595 RepID=A0A4R7YZI7_9FIRM|nr:prolyl oligopeptidase family serine peptidase [Halanaerobium saccharolyticum]RAK12740.1 prolyl oligopeptidase family protein [Halanaerobium saccharolyticum]TDW02953.1 prolyl oligopeptidase family protein [Halanaerobium saccharolyticum]TDX62863.1 prolyl oligopeptidase family protein [Halanaerobium saccharolyticum]
MYKYREKEDLGAIIDHFQGRENINTNNIFLFGASQGGLVSALTAEERREDIKGLLLLFPAFCIADNWNQKFPDSEDIPETHEFWGMRLGRNFFETIQGYDVYKNIGKYNKNVQIFVGDQDSIATAASCKKAEKLYSNVELEIFAGEGHGFSEAANRKVAEMTYQFVQRNKDS